MNQKLQPLCLVLFFTRKASLQTWAQNGSLEREIALYLRLQEKGVKISFVTYGSKQDLDYAKDLQGIEILCNRWNLPPRWYERLLPYLHAEVLRRADVIKTNQTNGAEIALKAAQKWHKPLIARCGYMWSDLAAHSGPDREAEVRKAQRIENMVFSAAQRVEVTTSSMRDYVLQQYRLQSDKVRVIPNYVLIDLFSPSGITPVGKCLCFVGRLEKEKNPLALVYACAGLDIDLMMIGDGSLRDSIFEAAGSSRVRVKLLGNVPHAELPNILRQSAIFLLVSPHEGHPKTLIEAMACGLAVIGADSPGIREIIRHGENGWLCKTDPASIRSAIQELLASPDLCRKLGQNAREFVVKHFSLDRIVEMELQILNGTVGQG
jgi:glycosyltransferase involved in cell wall biosynthesis